MPAPMCSTHGSARDEDKCAGHCSDTSVAGLGPRPEPPRLHVLRTGPGGLGSLENLGRIALRGSDNCT
eukprot:3245915-Prymnesium_polylepis.1